MSGNAEWILQVIGQASNLIYSLQSAFLYISELDLFDTWRTEHDNTKQYTWTKVLNNQVSAARLDRFYISNEFRNRVTNCNIHPVGLTDHHLITVVLNI